MISRASSKKNPGGDTIQMFESASQLRMLGVEVDIKYADEKPIYEEYDLIHFFNIIRPADILAHIRHHVPFVVSAIYVDYANVEANSSSLLKRFVSKFLNKNNIELIKTIARHILNIEKIQSLEYLRRGHKNSIIKIIENAKSIIFITNNEKYRFENDFGTIFKYYIIPNGINKEIFNIKNSEYIDREGVVCVARFEPLKNQLNLIRACKELNYKLTMIGKASDNAKEYYESCKKEENEKIRIFNYMSHQELVQFYKQSKVHALPSIFECSPLSTLEAAAMGCIPVISNTTDDKDNYSNYGFFCDSLNVESIKDALVKANNSNNSIELSKFILNEYTWDNTAYLLQKLYSKIL
jgi:glycosyltransferase involved in cell wall biosynthesis